MRAVYTLNAIGEFVLYAVITRCQGHASKMHWNFKWQRHTRYAGDVNALSHYEFRLHLLRSCNLSFEFIRIQRTYLAVGIRCMIAHFKRSTEHSIPIASLFASTKHYHQKWKIKIQNKKTRRMKNENLMYGERRASSMRRKLDEHCRTHIRCGISNETRRLFVLFMQPHCYNRNVWWWVRWMYTYE